MAIWWFDKASQGDEQPSEQPPDQVLTWHQVDRAKVVKQRARQGHQHADRTGRYLARWEARRQNYWRLTLLEPQELQELDHGVV